MEPHVGDCLIIRSRRVGQLAREGEIVELTSSASGGKRCRVRWRDGRESIVFPGTDAVVVPRTPARRA